MIWLKHSTKVLRKQTAKKKLKDNYLISRNKQLKVNMIMNKRNPNYLHDIFILFHILQYSLFFSNSYRIRNYFILEPQCGHNSFAEAVELPQFEHLAVCGGAIFFFKLTCFPIFLTIQIQMLPSINGTNPLTNPKREPADMIME